MSHWRNVLAPKQAFTESRTISQKSFGRMSWLKVNFHILSPNLANIPSIDGNITGSDILTNWRYHYVSSKRHSTEDVDSFSEFFRQIRPKFVQREKQNEPEPTFPTPLRSRFRGHLVTTFENFFPASLVLCL
jgi:hypothetical protein